MLKLKLNVFSRTIGGNWLLVTIILLGIFLRLYKAQEMFLYSHDQDLAGWVIKDIVVDKHLRLIGQETSTQGVFIGPLFYYLLIPFYLIFGMDPIGGVYMVAILGTFSILSFYFVFKKIFNEKVGFVAVALYTFSFYTIFNDREVVPTMPVILWTVWFLYCLHLILKDKQRNAFIILGILVGLIWHLNFALVLTMPLIPLALVLSKKKINIMALVYGILVFVITLTPLLVFELRHNFSQVKALQVALTTDQYDIVSGFEKFSRTVHLAGKNIRGFLWGDLIDVSYEALFILGVLLSFYLYRKNIITKNWLIIIFSWIFIYIGFFSLYSKILSEYYLNGIMIIWIFVLAALTSYLLSTDKLKKIGLLIVILFVGANLYRFFTIPINKSGYKYKKAIVEEIKKDAISRGYPCVSVSYITDPGLNTGYRYFFWLANLHVNRPDSGSPVYTIVYPLKKIFPAHKTFGAIGLIYPDYARYDMKEVRISCSGENSNLTDSLFGYTE